MRRLIQNTTKSQIASALLLFVFVPLYVNKIYLPLLKPFNRPVQVIGTLVLQLSLLISSVDNDPYSRFDRNGLVANMFMVVSLIVCYVVGALYNLAGMCNTSAVFLVSVVYCC